MVETLAKPKKPRWLLLLLLASIVALGVILLVCDHKFPTGPAQGDGFEGQSATAPSGPQFRVGTYNIAGGVGLDDKYDLQRTAGVIKDCDFVGLNEVHGYVELNQAKILGAMYLSRQYLFAPVERRWGCDNFGNGAVSTIAIKHWRRIPISSPSSPDNRNVLILQAAPANTNQIVTILLTHIDRKDDHERELELETVAKMFADAPAPAILLGDMNTMPEDPLAAILHMPGAVDVIDDDLPLEQSQKHLDWILLRGLHCVKAGFYPKGTSDHPFFWADVAVDSTTPQPSTLPGR